MTETALAAPKARRSPIDPRAVHAEAELWYRELKLLSGQYSLPNGNANRVYTRFMELALLGVPAPVVHLRSTESVFLFWPDFSVQLLIAYEGRIQVYSDGVCLETVEQALPIDASTLGFLPSIVTYRRTT